MKLLRKIIIAVFGIECYIKLASKVYIYLIAKGKLKSQYPEIFYLEKIIKPGYTCIDIGANLGYYSVVMSKLTGKNGKVLAVEPVPLFYNIWKKNIKASGINNLELFPYALGSENTTVKMGMPERDGLLHHGMTKIVTSANENYKKFFDAEMKVPDELFGNLQRLDFIKCDVEGYESIVFSNMLGLISKFRPVIQSELSGEENRKQVVEMLRKTGYTAMYLKEGKLLDVTTENLQSLDQDFYFVVESKIL